MCLLSFSLELFYISKHKNKSKKNRKSLDALDSAAASRTSCFRQSKACTAKIVSLYKPKQHIFSFNEFDLTNAFSWFLLFSILSLKRKRILFSVRRKKIDRRTQISIVPRIKICPKTKHTKKKNRRKNNDSCALPNYFCSFNDWFRCCCTLRNVSLSNIFGRFKQHFNYFWFISVVLIDFFFTWRRKREKATKSMNRSNCDLLNFSKC